MDHRRIYVLIRKPHLRLWWRILKKTVQQGLADTVPTLSAALAFYTMLSIVPMLALLLAAAASFYGDNGNAHAHIHDVLGKALSQQEADTVESILDTSSQQTGGHSASAWLNLIILFLGASGVFNQLQEAINLIWRTPQSRDAAIIQVIKERIMSFSLLIAVGFLMIASVIMNTVVAAILHFTTDLLPHIVGLVEAGTLAANFAFMTLIFALIFKIVPARKIMWSDVWLGSCVTALLFTLGQFLIGFYLSHANVAASYGAAGSMVALMVWIYYSAQIFLFGAELTYIYASQMGSCRSRFAEADS